MSQRPASELMPTRNERYQPIIPLDQLTKEEQDTIAQEVGLTWTEMLAAMSYSSQELIGLLTAQARIVQAIDVAQRRRELDRLNAELEDMYEHRQGLTDNPRAEGSTRYDTI